MPSSTEMKSIAKIKTLTKEEEVDDHVEEYSADVIRKKMWGVVVLHDKTERKGNFTMKPEEGDLVSCQDYRPDLWKNILSIHMPKTKDAVRKRLRKIFNRGNPGFLKTKEVEYLAELHQGAWEMLIRSTDDIQEALKCTPHHAHLISQRYAGYWMDKSDCILNQVEQFNEFLRSNILNLAKWNREITEKMCNKFGSVKRCEIALQYPLANLKTLMRCGVKKHHLENLLESQIELPENTQKSLLIYFDFLNNVRVKGHSYIHQDDFFVVCSYPDAEIGRALTVLTTQKCIYIENNILYDVVLYDAEKQAAARVARFLRQEPFSMAGSSSASTDEARQWLNPEQIQGIRNALSSPVSIITGGPGTGKTTTVKTLLDSFFDSSSWRDARVLVCAPTGKAVYRLIQSIGKEYTEKGVDFKTMHKFIYESKAHDDARERDSDVQDEKKYRLVICDEASMVGTLVFDQFMNAIIKKTTVNHLVFSGDKNQLEPVDPGCVFEQLLLCKDIPRVDLTQTYRQKHNVSGLSEGIRSIHRGCFPAEEAMDDGSLVIQHARDQRATNNPEIIHMVMATLREYLKKYRFDGEILVLVPSQKNFTDLQEEIRDLINPFTGHGNKNRKFRVGDFVSQTLNVYPDPEVDGYDRVLFNGMTGTILEMDEDYQPQTVRFTDGTVGGQQQLHLRKAYLNTVHKAQGSECAAVIFAFDNLHNFNKKIVYTAVSRAKNECTIIGPLPELKKCLEKQVETRRSRLFDYITEELALSSLASCAI